MIELIRVCRLTVTSMPYDLPGMFPNRLASPPDLPTTMSSEPSGPLTELLWLTEPGVATARFSALVRRTVSAAVGVKPPGPVPDGNGLTAPPTMSSFSTQSSRM
jgi:hypothetical protein